MSDSLPHAATAETDALRQAADIVASYVANNTVAQASIPDLIRAVHSTVAALGHEDDAAASPKLAERPKPAVPIARSVQHDHIVCLEDGKKLTMLKRYLRSRFDLSPEEYRRRWALPPDYPMVAPAYAARRSDFAKQIGLGKGVRRKG